MSEENKVIHLSHYVAQRQDIHTTDLVDRFKIGSKPESQLASRAMAFGIDFLAIMLINSSIHAAYALFINQYLYPMNHQSRTIILAGDIALHLSIFLLIFASYYLYCGVVLEGKTLGKKIFKLSVINEHFVINHLENNHHFSIQQSLQRTMGYLLSYLSCGTFFIFNFASEDNRGLADYLSGTRTVSDEWLKMMLEHKEFSPEEVSIDIRSLNKAA